MCSFVLRNSDLKAVHERCIPMTRMMPAYQQILKENYPFFVYTYVLKPPDRGYRSNLLIHFWKCWQPFANEPTFPWLVWESVLIKLVTKVLPTNLLFHQWKQINWNFKFSANSIHLFLHNHDLIVLFLTIKSNFNSLSNFSSRSSTWKKCSVIRKWNTRLVYQISRNLPIATNFTGTRSTIENMWYVEVQMSLLYFVLCLLKAGIFICCRRYPRTILWPITFIRIRSISSRIELFIFRRLCRPRKTIPRNNLFVACLQDKISRKFFLITW